MKPSKLRILSSTRNSVLLAWSPESVLSSTGSSSSLLQKTPRQSRSSLSSEDRKVSRTSLASIETQPIAPRRSPRTPKESCEEGTETPNCSTEQGKEWYTLQRKDKLLGWTTVYWGYRNEVEVSPLAPGEVHKFRLKTTIDDCEGEWCPSLTTATKDDVVSAASLHRALDQGHLSSVRKIVALRLQALEIPSKLGRTPLAVASARGDNSMATMLLTCGADVNAHEAGSHCTPLMTAAFRGTPELLHVLKERDASWTMADRFGQTALHYAAMDSQMSSLHMGMRETPNVDHKDYYGWTPLMLAVTLCGSLEAIEYMIENGSDVNAMDKRRQTVLMQAVLSGRPDIVELLIEKGAKVDIENEYGHTAFDIAKNSNNKGIQELLEILENSNDSLGKNDGTIVPRAKQAMPLTI